VTLGVIRSAVQAGLRQLFGSVGGAVPFEVVGTLAIEGAAIIKADRGCGFAPYANSALQQACLPCCCLLSVRCNERHIVLLYEATCLLRSLCLAIPRSREGDRGAMCRDCQKLWAAATVLTHFDGRPCTLSVRTLLVCTRPFSRGRSLCLRHHAVAHIMHSMSIASRCTQRC
jgi:hypothetical protein